MTHYFVSKFAELQRAIGPLDREHFIIIGLVVLAIGAFFLRGFGSRTGY